MKNISRETTINLDSNLVIQPTNVDPGFKVLCFNVMLTECIEYSKIRLTWLYVVFLDGSKAFDKISHWSLFKKRIDKHVPLYLGMIMCSWYQHQEMPVKWGHCISNSFSI